jgi:hypothetical protein
MASIVDAPGRHESASLERENQFGLLRVHADRNEQAALPFDQTEHDANVVECIFAWHADRESKREETAAWTHRKFMSPDAVRAERDRLERAFSGSHDHLRFRRSGRGGENDDIKRATFGVFATRIGDLVHDFWRRPHLD